MELSELHSNKRDMETTEYDKRMTFDVKTIDARQKTPSWQIKERWKTFMAETSCHGIKFVGNPATPMISRVIYGLVIVLMVISMPITVIELVANVFKYRSVTRTEVFVDLNMTFPAITFCNLCPYNFRGKNMSDPLYRLVAKESLYKDFLPDLEQLQNDSFNAFLQRTVVELYDEYSMDIGLLLADYDGKVLDEDDFELLNTDRGRCYQFNGLEYVKAHGPRRASNNDQQSGLRVIFNIKQDDYGIFGEGTAGIRVYISHPKSVPPLETHGLHVMPGTSTLMGLKIQQISFLPSPYKSYGSELCVEAREDSPELVAKMRNGSVYSFEGCRRQCAAYRASIKCSCYMPYLVLADLRPCTAQDFFYGCYSKEFSRVMAQAETQCDCPRSCSLTIYDVEMSMSQMPSKIALESSLKMFNDIEESQIRQNLLQVRVFFASPLVRLEKHEPEYTVESFISSLGGQMGIYLGASLITLLEVLEMVTYVLQAIVRRIIGVFLSKITHK